MPVFSKINRIFDKTFVQGIYSLFSTYFYLGLSERCGEEGGDKKFSK
jgi:hypothetical protein